MQSPLGVRFPGSSGAVGAESDAGTVGYTGTDGRVVRGGDQQLRQHSAVSLSTFWVLRCFGSDSTRSADFLHGAVGAESVAGTVGYTGTDERVGRGGDQQLQQQLAVSLSTFRVLRWVGPIRLDQQISTTVQGPVRLTDGSIEDGSLPQNMMVYLGRDDQDHTYLYPVSNAQP